MELYLAFQMATAALSGIRSCVDMLNEGKVEIQRIKKGVESAQEIAKEVKNFWSWLTKLIDKLTGKAPSVHVPIVPTIDAPAAKAAPAEKSKKDKDEYVDVIPSEDDMIEKFLDNFQLFLDAQAAILDHIAEKRAAILKVWNPKQNSRKEAVELIRAERRIDAMALELSEIMAAAPRKLGNVREQFAEKYQEVLAAQAKARAAQRKAEAQARAKEWSERSDRIDRRMAFFWGFLLVFYFWLFAFGIWLNNTKAMH
jgi:hypothetical protein